MAVMAMAVVMRLRLRLRLLFMVEQPAHDTWQHTCRDTCQDTEHSYFSCLLMVPAPAHADAGLASELRGFLQQRLERLQRCHLFLVLLLLLQLLRTELQRSRPPLFACAPSVHVSSPVGFEFARRHCRYSCVASGRQVDHSGPSKKIGRHQPDWVQFV